MPFDVAILFPNSLRVALESWLAEYHGVGYHGPLSELARQPDRHDHEARAARTSFARFSSDRSRMRGRNNKHGRSQIDT